MGENLQMVIKFSFRDHEVDLKIESGEILMKKAWGLLFCSPQAYLPVRNGELLTDGDMLHAGETIRMLSVTSGESR